MKLRFFYYIRIGLEILGKNQLFRLQEQQTEPDTKPTECEDQRQSSSGAMTAMSPSPAPHGGRAVGQGWAQPGVQRGSRPLPDSDRAGLWAGGARAKGPRCSRPGTAGSWSSRVKPQRRRRMRSLGLWHFRAISPPEPAPSFPGTAANLLFALASA